MAFFSIASSWAYRLGVPKKAPTKPYVIVEYWDIFTCSNTVMCRHKRRF